jgi:putative metallohydrolase (TIGR04338 family)
MDDRRPPRDSQRARVYRAELPLPSSPLPGLTACATFADRVVGTLWWQSRFPEHSLDHVPRLRPGNGARQAFFRKDDDGPTITLPRRYRTKGIVLHELIHWVLDEQRDLPPHGRTFTRVLLDANEEFCGHERADALADSYREQRVKVGRAARTGPDGRLRYGWDERLRLGRGRVLTLRWRDESGECREMTGAIDGFERGTTVRVLADGQVVRVPTTTMWDVTGPG